MKTYYILFTCCFISFIGFSQQLQLKKASPFTAVKWENNQPIVQFETKWYVLEKLDIYTTQEILDFCKLTYGKKWQKRFSEDLVEVLNKMDSSPNLTVNLILSNNDKKQSVIGTYTFNNRQKVLDFNNDHQKQKFKKITISQAIEDIMEFQKILEERSSYVHLTDYNYKNAIALLKENVKNSKQEVDINYVTYELAKIMSAIGDRHSSVKNEGFVDKEYPEYNLQFPFLIAPLDEKALALSINKEKYYKANFPFIKSINYVLINQLIDSLVYKSKKAPKEAKFTKGVAEIQQYGKLHFINNLKLPKQLKIVFSDGKKDTTAIIQLQEKRLRYNSKLELKTYKNANSIKEGNFNSISKTLKGNIGYISLPEMFSFDKIKGLETFIDSTFIRFKTTKALIIDVRFNPGGTRDLVQKFSNYLIPKTNTPWVANVAYLRTDLKNKIHSSMASRYLYPNNSSKFTTADKEAIKVFSKNFTVDKKFDTTKYSKPHYMVLKSGNTQYQKRIYILVNEKSFSAATVFTSAFKGLPNIKIVGVTTDGSSGNSKVIRLLHSNIRGKVSTMLSFQRNGKTLDGFGTKPDIYISEDKAQVLEGQDSQLIKLIEIIENRS